MSYIQLHNLISTKYRHVYLIKDSTRENTFEKLSLLENRKINGNLSAIMPRLKMTMSHVFYLNSRKYNYRISCGTHQWNSYSLCKLC